MNHLAAIIIMASVAMGMFYCLQDGEVFAKLRPILVKIVPKLIAESIHACPRCMVLGWGLPVACLLGFIPLSLHALYLIPVYLVAAVGFQHMVNER